MQSTTSRLKFVIRKQAITTAVPPKKIAITLGEEMEEILTDWYAALNQSVPPEELQICREADATEHKEYLKMVALATSAPIYAYGTPEFWKDHWKRKADKKAALTAAGLTEADLPNKKGTAKKQKSSVPKSAK